MELPMISRLRSREMASATSTWRGQDFPKMAATRAPLETRAFSVGSVSGVLDGWCVLPKAASFAFLSSTSFMALKNSVSTGLAPGQPPSM